MQPIRKKVYSASNQLKIIAYKRRCVDGFKCVSKYDLAEAIGMPRETFKRNIWNFGEIPPKDARKIIEEKLKFPQEQIWPDIDFKELEKLEMEGEKNNETNN